MWRIQFLVLMLFGILFAGCDTEQSKTKELGANSAITKVTVKQVNDDWWEAEFTFHLPQKAVIFSRSLNDYRGQSWRSIDPNATFERIGGFDAILFKEATKKASLRFQPYSGKVRREYTPFIPFSDGSYAVYTGQFEVLGIESRAAIESLDGRLDTWSGQQGQLAVRVESPHPLILKGEILRDHATYTSKGGDTYIYVGTAKITQGKDFSGVIDTGLPKWINDRFDNDLSEIFTAHRELWEVNLEEKSTVLLSFKGFDNEGFSNKGGALGNLLTLELSGSALKKENQKILQYIHWFFAHEVAHVFQSRDGNYVENLDENWMGEGAANAMANQVLMHKKLADQKYIDQTYAQEFTECSAYLENNKLSDYPKSGAFNIPYACGDLIAQITDASLNEHTLFDFWNILFEDIGADTQYSSKDYFKTLKKLGAPMEVIEKLQTLTSEKVDDPKLFLRTLIEQSGLSAQFTSKNELTSLQLP